MFTKIVIENFEGIPNKIELNFLAKSRNREKQKSLYKTHDNKYINKLVGILASNASGKTTVINGIGTIGSLMTYPVLSNDFYDELENIKKLLSKPNTDFNVVDKMINNLQKSFDINVQNASNLDQNTNIETEMYIENENEELEGYYDYNLKLNGIKRKIEEEIFTFRRNYEDKPKDIIRISGAKEGQLYYINRYYKNILNIDEANTENIKYKYKYIKPFIEHYNENSKIAGTEVNDMKINFLNFYQKHSTLMENFIKIVDPKIDKIKVEKNKENEELYYVLKNGGKINTARLSKGTQRFMKLIINAVNIINKKGVFIIDEIEANMHKELVFLILRLFTKLESNCSQIIFTTNSPEVFECTDENNDKIFKQDAIYFLNNVDGNVSATRMSDIRINNKRVKGDALVSSIYKKEDVAMQPTKEIVDRFIKNINKSEIK